MPPAPRWTLTTRGGRAALMRKPLVWIILLLAIALVLFWMFVPFMAE